MSIAAILLPDFGLSPILLVFSIMAYRFGTGCSQPARPAPSVSENPAARYASAGVREPPPPPSSALRVSGSRVLRHPQHQAIPSSWHWHGGSLMPALRRAFPPAIRAFETRAPETRTETPTLNCASPTVHGWWLQGGRQTRPTRHFQENGRSIPARLAGTPSGRLGSSP